MGLLAATLERVDAEGAPAYLESSNPINTPRYERLGFSVCGRVRAARGRPERHPDVARIETSLA